MTGKADAEANLVPVDMCVNAMIASAWDVHERHKLQLVILTCILKYYFSS